MKKKLWFVLTRFLIVGALLSAWSAAPAAQRDRLIIGIPAFPPSADQDMASHPMQWLLTFYTASWAFEAPRALGGFPGAEDVSVPIYGWSQPRNFESWGVSEDGLTWTFRIRPGNMSYYGNEFTTEDIKWSHERIFGNNFIMMFFWGVGGLGDLESSFKIIDKYTYTLTTEKPNPVLNAIMRIDPYMRFDATEAKKHATADDPWANEWIRTHGTSGFGPWVIDEWVPGDRVTLLANPNYVGGKPKIDKLILVVIPESANRLAAIKDGTIDLAIDLSPEQILSLEGAEGVRTIALPLTMHTWGVMNNSRAPFDNKLVRQAMNFAMPKEAICDTAYLGFAKPWRAALPEVFPAATGPEEFPYSFDLDKAKALLDEAGYSDGFEMELIYDSSFQPWETAATMIRTTLAKIGVTVNIRSMPAGPFTSAVNGKEFHFALWHDMPILSDPNYGMNLSYKTGAFVNYAGYSNPEVDSMLEEGMSILDTTERLAHHRDIQRIVLDDAPIVFAWNESFLRAIRSDIRGLEWVDGGKLQPSKMYFIGD